MQVYLVRVCTDARAEVKVWVWVDVIFRAGFGLELEFG